jgi:hypothetical protein
VDAGQVHHRDARASASQKRRRAAAPPTPSSGSPTALRQ